MASGSDDKIVPLRPEQVAPAGGGPHDPGTEARVAKLEAAVEHLQSDVTEVKAALGRIEPRIAEMAGALPHLATKADLARRPTVAGIIAIVALVAAVASMPIWPEWAAAIKAIASAGR
jgi:ferric-dicitrate binding protein FerR (iron transport regulator)